MIFINYFRKTTASSTATTFNAHTIWFRINVLSGTNSICKDVLFRENVLDGTNCESHTARDAPTVNRVTASERNGASRFHSPAGDVTERQRGTTPRGPELARKKAVVLTNHSLFSVRAKGLEPIRTRHQILSLAWLPITTRSQFPPEGS